MKNIFSLFCLFCAFAAVPAVSAGMISYLQLFHCKMDGDNGFECNPQISDQFPMIDLIKDFNEIKDSNILMSYKGTAKIGMRFSLADLKTGAQVHNYEAIEKDDEGKVRVEKYLFLSRKDEIYVGSYIFTPEEEFSQKDCAVRAWNKIRPIIQGQSFKFHLAEGQYYLGGGSLSRSVSSLILKKPDEIKNIDSLGEVLGCFKFFSDDENLKEDGQDHIAVVRAESGELKLMFFGVGDDGNTVNMKLVPISYSDSAVLRFNGKWISDVPEEPLEEL
jgi:hypothetical protein